MVSAPDCRSEDEGSIPSMVAAEWTGEVPARPHKPCNAGSNPVSATNVHHSPIMVNGDYAPFAYNGEWRLRTIRL